MKIGPKITHIWSCAIRLQKGGFIARLVNISLELNMFRRTFLDVISTGICTNNDTMASSTLANQMVCLLQFLVRLLASDDK